MNLATGLFELEQTDLYLPDVLPIAVTRTYRTRDVENRPFGKGATHPYAMFLWSALQVQEADLILPDGGRIHYVRTTPGIGFADAVFEHKETATTSATPTAFYKSVLWWRPTLDPQGPPGWDLRLKDGTVYQFGENAPLQAIKDRYGNTIKIEHANGQTGNVTRVVSPHGRWLEFTYNGSLITQVKDNIGRTVSYTYDGQTRLWKVTDPLNQVTEYTYDADHRMTSVKNRNGVVSVTNEYYTAAPTLGWVKKQTFADGGTYQFAYTVVNGKSTQTDVTGPNGSIRRTTLNSDGYTLSDTVAFGAPEQRTSTAGRQPGAQFITSTTDGVGHQTVVTYDGMKNVTSVTRLAGTPDALTTTYTYDSTLQLPLTVTDPLNHTTTFVYDSLGKLTSVTDPLQHQMTFTYNSKGQRTSITDALQRTTTYVYDGPDLKTITEPGARVTTQFHDSLGRLIAVTDAMGRTTRYTYDLNNRQLTRTDPLGNQTTFTYFPDGSLQSVVNPNQHTTSFTYDVMGRLTSRTDPLLRVETYIYDVAGNLQQSVDRKGQITSRTYDALGRPNGITYAGGSSVTYTFDDRGRITQVVDSLAGTISRTYDDLDRVTSETTPQGTI